MAQFRDYSPREAREALRMTTRIAGRPAALLIWRLIIVAERQPGLTIALEFGGGGWWTGLDSNQRTGNPGRFTVCCL